MTTARVKLALRALVLPVCIAGMFFVTADKVSATVVLAGKFRAFPVHGGIGKVVTGDVNGDGKLDAVVAASYGNRRTGGLSVLIGCGDGTFNESTYVPTGGRVNPDLALGDLNGDRKLDVAVVSFEENAVAVLLGRGDGTFDPYVRYPTGQAPHTVAIGDINNDGKPDLVTTGVQDTSISVFLGHGDGTFEARRNVSVEPCSALAIGDFNHDGNLDIVTARVGGGISIMMGYGDGTFAAGAVYAASGFSRGMVVGDLNGDDKPDVAVVNSLVDSTSGHTASVFLGRGDGTFTDAVEFETGLQPASITIADFDGDRKPDLATANAGDNTISILDGLGDGTFMAPTSYGSIFFPNTVVTGDLNGDARPDVVTLENGLFASVVAVHRNVGAGTFPNTIDYPAGTSVNGNPMSVALGDLDADGVIDLVTANPADNMVSIRLGHGDGTFADAASHYMGYSPAAAAIADLNADGKPDLVTASQGDNVAVVALGNGDGSFRDIVGYPTGPSPYALVVADFDGNGTLDLAIERALSVGPPLSILFGNGDGSFIRGPDFGIPGVRSLTASDVNGDGRPDLVALIDVQVLVFLNLGNGTFDAPTSYETELSPSSLTVGDITSDGMPDIVVVYGERIRNSIFSGLNSIFAGRGNGTFEPRVDNVVAQDASSPAIADVDGDGKPDLLTLSFETNTISVHAGRGDMTFQPEVLFGTGNRPNSLAVADVNGDRRPDVISVSSGTRSVSVLLNTTRRQPPGPGKLVPWNGFHTSD
jgi:hypothetical protein